MSASRHSDTGKLSTLLVLVLAGEIIFGLPFNIPRFFRPNLLEVFGLSNAQLGDVFAFYGIIAMLAYFPGGILADRFAPRTLISVSLAATALGGLYLYTLPPLVGLYAVFAWWGLTSILLFWSALIKATRTWGGKARQGLAFGLLDGGRGLVASLLATVIVLLLGERLGGTGGDRAALQAVILYYTLITGLVAVIAWFVLPSDHAPRRPGVSRTPTMRRPRWHTVLALPSVWLQAGVVVCAYCGYKALDNYGVYAVDVLHMDAFEAAKLSTWASFSRPVAAVAAGLWADRWRSSGVVIVSFGVGAGAFGVLATGIAGPETLALVLANVLVTFIAVYALRGIYFGLIEEARLDLQVTGRAVGLVSVVGFTPDVFFGSLTGRILDANPGATGFHHYFFLMAGISLAGLVFTQFLVRRLARTRRLEARSA